MYYDTTKTVCVGKNSWHKKTTNAHAFLSHLQLRRLGYRSARQQQVEKRWQTWTIVVGAVEIVVRLARVTHAGSPLVAHDTVLSTRCSQSQQSYQTRTTKIIIKRSDGKGN